MEKLTQMTRNKEGFEKEFKRNQKEDNNSKQRVYMKSWRNQTGRKICGIFNKIRNARTKLSASVVLHPINLVLVKW